jgi:DNA-binding NarL/FixJ family response regulator
MTNPYKSGERLQTTGYKKYTVLVIEDISALREHLRQILQHKLGIAIEIVEAADGTAGIKLARTLKPDLIIMDISMPDLNGIKAAQQIWTEQPEMKILFWSQYHRQAYVRELGKIVPDESIHGYALKSESDDKLVFAISSVLLHDNPYIDPIVRGVQLRLQSKDQSLTDVEYETLLDICLGLTDRAIATRRHISVRGVQSRVAMLATKLLCGHEEFLKESAKMEVFNPRNRMIMVALERGLIDVDEVCQLNKELTTWLEQEYAVVLA